MANLVLNEISNSILIYLVLAVCHIAVSQTNAPGVVQPGPLTVASLHSTNDPVEGSWNVTEKNVICILLKATITLSVNYTDVNNASRITELAIPVNAQATGSCGNDQNIVLTWMQPNVTQPHGLNNTLTLEFHANTTNKNGTKIKEIPLGKYALTKVNAVVHKDPSLFPNATNPTAPFVIELSGLAIFPTSLNHSYACQSVNSVEGGESSQQRVNQLKLLLGSLQVEAFKNGPKGGNNGEFSAAEHCAADEISSGSVVGTVIVTLLIIVLAALGVAALATYYLKRKRAAGTTGYENM